MPAPRARRRLALRAEVPSLLEPVGGALTCDLLSDPAGSKNNFPRTMTITQLLWGRLSESLERPWGALTRRKACLGTKQDLFLGPEPKNSRNVTDCVTQRCFNPVICKETETGKPPRETQWIEASHFGSHGTRLSGGPWPRGRHPGRVVMRTASSGERPEETTQDGNEKQRSEITARNRVFLQKTNSGNSGMTERS